MVILKAIAAGFALFLTFAPFNIWPAAIISAGLLYSTLIEQDFKSRFIATFLFGLTFFLPLLHWSSTYVGALPWIILATGQAMLFSLMSIVPYRKDFASALLFAAVFTFVELIRMKAPFGGFGWGRIGHTQTEIFADLYPTIGVTGITFVIVLFGTLLVNRKLNSILFFSIAVFLLAALPNSLKLVGTVDLVGVQGGVDKLGLDFNDRAFSVLQNHIDVTKNLVGKSDLIVWPENSSDIDPMQNPKARELITNLISKKKEPILVGAVEQSAAGPLNSSILFDSSGALQSRYIKQDLAPFGEYIPLRLIAEFISPEAKSVRNFISGDEWVIHRIKEAKILPVICFELLDDDHLRDGVKLADVIVNQTNNATFGRSNQSAQQLQIARARSAEFGRETFAVSTTGFTAHIDNRGQILQELPRFKAGNLEASVKRYEGQTVASRISSWHWFGFLGLLIAISRLRYLADN